MFRFIRVKWSRKNVSILKVNNRKINFVHFLRTTFKILTGEIDATSGNAVINGFDINKSRFNAIRNLGFCPQYDYLPEYLTVKQTLKLFSNLRGLEDYLISTIVNEMINVFKLNEFSNKLVQNLRYYEKIFILNFK